ncbi:hypothetical protein OHA98_21350 [Streptomyces sp. NBC_00654]|uniref:hypothetical protein n=1 Tax=Streptomyces sp. NBC_00654 TaxID=2975799 RepID=UPI00224E4380|nr:hypothetical protein [Streptomyces sp. NBC_00654]MCX4967265.1 hypothetical protein [Streptomyces sp. NBC_00654]
MHGEDHRLVRCGLHLRGAPTRPGEIFSWNTFVQSALSNAASGWLSPGPRSSSGRTPIRIGIAAVSVGRSGMVITCNAVEADLPSVLGQDCSSQQPPDDFRAVTAY